MHMIPGIEEHYRKIADAMVAAIPGTWKSAKVEATFYPYSIDFDTEYQAENDSLSSFACTSEISRAFPGVEKDV